MRRDGPSDKTIVRRARQGDRQAFLTLLQRYDPRLRRLAFRLLADTNRLERVLSRAYLKAWRSLPFLKRGEPAAGWLYRIVYNACVNEMRWEPSRPRPSPPEGSPVPLPATSIERRLLALRALDAAERVPLVLVDGEGLSLDTAARMMRREPAEVAAKLTQARGRWRAYVNGQPEPLPEPSATPASAEPPRRDPTTLGPKPSPAATLSKLAALAAPTAPHEPAGHVKLLAPGPGLGAPPPVAAKPPPARPPGSSVREARLEPASPNGDGASPPAKPAAPSRSSRSAAVAGPDGDGREARGSAEAGDRKASPEQEPAVAAGAGAGARRKRRRDAKRAVRAGGPGGAATGAKKPGRDGASSRDDRDPT